MLDDYEPKYKLSGVKIVQEMLNTVPGSLLKRTGVEGLIRSVRVQMIPSLLIGVLILFSNCRQSPQSLSNCLGHLQAEESPNLIREAINAQLSLTLLTTRAGERAHFDQLCLLLGEGVIGGVWFYGYEKEEVILASIEALPNLITALGIGCVRFLKV